MAATRHAVRKKNSLTPTSVLLGLLVTVAGSHIEFTSNVDTVQVSVTSQLSMKCSLYNRPAAPSPPTTANPPTTAAPAGTGLVGRRALPDDAHDDDESKDAGHITAGNDAVTNNGVEEERESGAKEVSRRSSVDDDPIRQITLITISRDGQDVGSITPFTSAQLEAGEDKTNVNVSGDVKGSSGGDELGFLSLTWAFPTNNQTGRYSCEIRAITEAGHAADYSKTIDIRSSEVSLEDMVKEMSLLKRQMSANAAQTRQTIEALKADIDNKTSTHTNTLVKHNDSLAVLQARIDSQKITLFDYQTQLSNVKNELSSTKSELSTLKDDASSALHVEQGMLNCGSFPSWNDGSATMPVIGRFSKTKSMSHVFSKPYRRTPVVFLSQSFIQAKYDKQYLYFSIFLKNVTSTGFEMVCGGTTGSSYALDYLSVDWISVAS